MAQHYHLYMSIHVYMKRMTRLCDIKYCVYDNLEVYRTHTSDYCVRTVLLRIPPPVYSVKYLDATKHQNTTSHLMEGNLLIQIDRGSIYYPFICLHKLANRNILIVTTFFGCKIFVHKLSL